MVAVMVAKDSVWQLEAVVVIQLARSPIDIGVGGNRRLAGRAVMAMDERLEDAEHLSAVSA
jgi:hypothetical protein